MNKKIIALMLSLAMVASVAACSKDDDEDETTTDTYATGAIEPTDEETYETADPRGEKFVGDWGYERCTVSISPEDGGYKAFVTWSSSYNEHSEWIYSCMYDESIDGLTGFGTQSVVTYSDDSSDPVIEEVSTDEMATFTFNEDGTLAWNDEVNGQGDGLALAFIPDPISVPELRTWYFNVVTSYHLGTAGSSLEMAHLAYVLYSDAGWYDISEVDTMELSENLLTVYESLTDEERATFDENILYVADLIAAAQEDWEANKGPFEDCGDANLMNAYLNSEGIDEDWAILLGCTLTMGNSNEG